MTFNSRFAAGSVALLTCSLVVGCSNSPGTSSIPSSPGYADSSASAPTSQLNSLSAVQSSALSSSDFSTSPSVDITAALSSQRPAQSEAFVNSFGVDSRFGTSSEESDSWSTSSRSLIDSGIKHLRDGSGTGSRYLTELASHGISHSIGFGIKGLTSKTIIDSLEAIGTGVDFVEASNEYDNSGYSNWASTLRHAQETLYNAVNGSSRYHNLTVLAPSLANVKDASVLGGVPGDAASLHNATCDFNPATANRSVETLKQMKEVEAEAPGKPVWTTETGYDNDTRSSCYISEDGAAKYIPRTLAYRWNLGMPRSYFDSWSDETGTHFAHMGLVTENGQPKKQYYAVQSLLALLSDPGGSSFTPSSLTYGFGGHTENVMHTLLQKRNGEYELLVWLEVSSWDHDRKASISVSAAPVSINFSRTVSDVGLYTYGSNWQLRKSASVSKSGRSISLRVTDSISILTFR